MNPKPSFSVSTVAPDETMASKAGSIRLIVSDCGARALSARNTDPLTRAAPQTTKTFMVNPGTTRSAIQRREQSLPLRWKVLIDRVHHEADSEVVAHDHHELHGLLPSEVSDHLLPQLAAHAVLAIQRASKGDERGVLVGEARDVLVVLDDVDDRLLEPLPQSCRLVGRPLVLLVDLSGDDEDRELKIARADRTVNARWDTEAALPRTVVRDVRGSGTRLDLRPGGQQLPSFLVQICLLYTSDA